MTRSNGADRAAATLNAAINRDGGVETVVNRGFRETEYGPICVPAPSRIRDAADLLQSPLAPVRYVLPNWMAEGLTLLAAMPKIGKSTLALQMAVAVASGGVFWGETVPPGNALLIDLETNERRLHRKLDAIQAQLRPEALRYATEWRRGDAGVDAIAEAFDADPALRLVIVDPLQRFRDPQANHGRNAYEADYEACAPLHQVCRQRPGRAILAVHHKKKGVVDDPIESINGSVAIAGAADALWIMNRRGNDFSLHVEGRDWEQEENDFSIERAGGLWRLASVRCQYSHADREVLQLLERAGPMTGAELGRQLGVSRQAAGQRLNGMSERGLVEFKAGAWRALV